MKAFSGYFHPQRNQISFFIQKEICLANKNGNKKNWVKHELSIPSPFHKNSFKQIYIPKVQHYFCFCFFNPETQRESKVDSKHEQQRIREFIQVDEHCVHVLSNGDCTST